MYIDRSVDPSIANKRSVIVIVRTRASANNGAACSKQHPVRDAAVKKF